MQEASSRTQLGSGIANVRATVQNQTTTVHDYIKMGSTNDMLRDYLAKTQGGRRAGIVTVMEGETPAWHVPLAENSYQWLDKAELKYSTEALIIAGQGQAQYKIIRG